MTKAKDPKRAKVTHIPPAQDPLLVENRALRERKIDLLVGRIDVAVFGQVEPNAHVRDYFVGDGFTTKFYLSQIPFTRGNRTILDEEYRALDPAVWSDTITDELDIDFAWLDSPDYADEFVRARERFETAMRHHVELSTETAA